MNKKAAAIIAAAAALAAVIAAPVVPREKGLSPQEFMTPPDWSRIDTWWHWSEGNITKDGIRKDLESMHDNGIRRATILNVVGPAQHVDRVVFASDEWFGMFRYALDIADSLGMKIGVHNCDGWSTSGGPWITPDMSMKTYTWSSSYVTGGQSVDIDLPEPTSYKGFYRDFAVVAFPSQRAGNSFVRSCPSVTCNGQDISNVICDANPKSWHTLREGDAVTFRFGQPFTMDRVSLFSYLMFSWEPIAAKTWQFRLYTSEDGENWGKGEPLTFTGSNRSESVRVPKRSARWFRLEYVKGDMDLNAAELALLNGDEPDALNPSFPNFLYRMSHIKSESESDFDRQYDSSRSISPDDIMDLSACMSEDGHLSWKDVPAGEWCIVRFGYTGTGATNLPATAEGTGLECDKMDPEAVAFHFSQFPQKLVEAAGSHTGNTFSFLLTDSWECGYQSWTAAFPEAFSTRNGYDIRKWIPVLCGNVVGDVQKTEDFVHDFHCTISDLITRNYYGKMSELCHSAGLEMHAEPIYQDVNSWLYPPCNALLPNTYCDLPMTEFWADVDDSTKEPGYHKCARPIHSFPIDAALLYDKRVIGAEAYTGYASFSDTPELVKPFGDRAFCSGINQLILHSYTHQPLDNTPHVTLRGLFGNIFNRNNPWWGMARGWSDYQARVQYILQQGDPVVDVLYYIGDGFPERIPERMLAERIPSGYRANACGFDFLDKLPGHFPLLVIPEGAMLEEKTRDRLSWLESEGVEVCHDMDGVTIPLGIAPDFSCDSDDFLFVHRHLKKQDAYFVFNQDDAPYRGEFTFRVTGTAPQIWDPETGRIYAPEAWHRTEDGRTAVTVCFKGRQSLFIVFTDGKCTETWSRPAKTIPVENLSVRMEFAPFYDAGIAPVECDRLLPLNAFDDRDIKYFGGTVTYSISFDAPPAVLDADERMTLNLGKISATAQAYLNGEYIGNPWHSGQDLSISGLKDKGNVLTVRVGTTLRNRMAGDMIMYGEPVNIKSATQTSLFVRDDSQLQPSGISGPLTINIY